MNQRPKNSPVLMNYLLFTRLSGPTYTWLCLLEWFTSTSGFATRAAELKQNLRQNCFKALKTLITFIMFITLCSYLLDSDSSYLHDFKSFCSFVSLHCKKQNLRHFCKPKKKLFKQGLKKFFSCLLKHVFGSWIFQAKVVLATPNS